MIDSCGSVHYVKEIVWSCSVPDKSWEAFRTKRQFTYILNFVKLPRLNDDTIFHRPKIETLTTSMFTP